MEQPRLLDQVRNKIRLKHYSMRTEETYVQWVKRFVLFHHKRHPCDMSATEVEQFLTTPDGCELPNRHHHKARNGKRQHHMPVNAKEVRAVNGARLGSNTFRQNG